MTFSLEEIRAAAADMQHVVHRTPLETSRTFSARSGVELCLKAECLQRTGSWKLRGAYTALSRLSAQQRDRGVVTFSAGNWGQGIALASSLLGIRATVVLPEHVNKRKLSAIRGYGADIVVHGLDSESLFAKARELEGQGLVLLNPLENDDMMLGAATLGLELIEQRRDLQAIVVPVGGGSLIAGIALAARHLDHRIQVYGVQPRGACAMYESLRQGSVVELDHVDTIADGLAVKRPSARTVALLAELVADVGLVSDEEIREAMYLLLERAKLLVEPSAAVGLAAVLHDRLPSLRRRKTALILTGGNADLALLADVLLHQGGAQT